MKVMFWNTRHLGASTDEARKAAIARVSEGVDPDILLLCELTTQAKHPPAQPLTYRKASPWQLCYGCMRGGVSHQLTPEKPVTTPEFAQAGFKGGNDFTGLCDRAVGFVGVHGAQNVHLYVFHAPSGEGSAQKAMAFLACALDAKHGNNTPWLLVGDFNIQPTALGQTNVGITINDLIRSSGQATHQSTRVIKIPLSRNRFRFRKTVTEKELDYALSNMQGVIVRRIRCSRRHHNSDHYPIVVEW